MLASIVKFTDDSAGLERTLRLLQGFCTIAVGLAASALDADFWAKTRGQFALGRRYFRLLKWYPCFVSASNAMSVERPLRRPILTVLDTTKWSFLSLYFFLEMFTISNAMGVTTFEWGPTVQHEANKCWIYSLLASILLSLVELIWSNAANANTNPDVKEKKNKLKKPVAVSESTEEKTTPVKSKIYTQLIVDCCDILLPGSAVGWIPAPLAAPLAVGIASTMSTTLTGSQIWNRVHQSSR